MAPNTTELICAVSRHADNLAGVVGRSILLMAGGGCKTDCFTLAAILDICFLSSRLDRWEGGFITRRPSESGRSHQIRSVPDHSPPLDIPSRFGGGTFFSELLAVGIYSGAGVPIRLCPKRDCRVPFYPLIFVTSGVAMDLGTWPS